jgi:hypothetical protein
MLYFVVDHWVSIAFAKSVLPRDVAVRLTWSTPLVFEQQPFPVLVAEQASLLSTRFMRVSFCEDDVLEGQHRG